MIKKIIPGLTLCLILLLITSLAVAKEGPKTGSKLNKTLIERATKYIDVNQIRSSVTNNGVFTRHPISGDSDCEWPKGSGKLICYAAGLMLMGTVGGELRTACCDYYPEYQAGPILPDGSADDANKAEYVVYKVHKQYPNGDADLEIDAWDAWPADQGAPVNPDGSIKWTGDEMLYCIINDLSQGLHSTSYNSLPIGVEVHMLVFGFDKPDALGNSIFVKYTIINKGAGDLENAYVGMWSDVDNGDANDDLVGYDMDLGMGYCYGGDAYDATYGDRPPALGFDFFQGPMVDSPGDTVRLGDGRVFPDKRIISATSFNKYYNTAGIYGDPPRTAAGGAQMYNLMQGLMKDGAQWINPLTGQPTTYMNTGDPVSGTGWLSTMEFPPSDIRLMISAGPFNLAVGDTQEIVSGMVIAQSKDRLASVALLKFYDKELQQAYDLGFQVPASPPPPKVVVTEYDREILLTWEKNAESYDDAGYKFEGYNVYIGDSEGGPWKRVATYDIVNGITIIKDEKFDESTGRTLENFSAFGNDVGLKYNYKFTRDYNDRPIANGRPYYLCITSYGANLEGLPRILESSKAPNINFFTVVPHLPRPGTVVNQKFGEQIAVNHYTGTADTAKYDVWVQIWDPLHVETANYEVTVNPDSSWTLWKNGQAVPNYTNSKEYGFDRNIADKTIWGTGLDFFFGFDADFELTPVKSFKAELKTASSDPTLLSEFSGPYEEDPVLTKDNLAKNGKFKKGTTDPAILYNKLEVRFTGVMDSTTMQVTSGGSLATLVFSFGDPANFIPRHPANPIPGSRDPFLIRIPFEIWDIDRNIQLNVSFADNKQKLSDSLFVPTWAPRGECTVFIVASQYDEQVHNVAYTGADTMATWMFIVKSGAIWKTGDVVQLTFPQPVPVTGKEMTLNVKGTPVNLQPDKFKFSIKGVETNVIADAKKKLDLINVYPNPYLAFNIMERRLHQEHVMFINLPEKCTIRIFTLSGQLVYTIEHDDAVNTTHRWELRNEANLPVASGLYFAHIEVPNVGEKILKMAIVFREQRLKNL